MKKKRSHYTRLLRVVRQEWSRGSSERRLCFANAKVRIDRGIERYKCAKCPGLFALSDVQCDHKNPVRNTIPNTKQEFLDSFDRLYVSIEGLQILCLICHKEKTKNEMQIRKTEELIGCIGNYLKATSSPCNATKLLTLDLPTLKKIHQLIKIVSKQQGNNLDSYQIKLNRLIGKYL